MGTRWEKREQPMIDRVCISLNNRCNLSCTYCHFHEKGILESAPMNVPEILQHICGYAVHPFKIGFVGNGEPFLDFPMLRDCLRFLEDIPFIQTYTITNGTISLDEEDIDFLKDIASMSAFRWTVTRSCMTKTAAVLFLRSWPMYRNTGK